MRTATSSHDNDSSNSSVYKALIAELHRLDFLAFRMCVALWLGAKGYRHMRSFERTASRGRRRVAGPDFVAIGPHAGDREVAIQVRFWRTRLDRRPVDELRGFMDRYAMRTGLIITTAPVSVHARTIAEQFDDVRIRLMSVQQLAGSMAALGLGIRPTRRGYAVDQGFFRSLRKLSFGSSPRGQQRPKRDAQPSNGNRPGDLRLVYFVGVTLGLVLLLVLAWELGALGRCP